MSLNAETKAKIVADFSRGTNDTGSPEVQVALLTAPDQPSARPFLSTL